ncbi:rhomboid family intramembrane serine protease [Dethiobacter alkaliphilus]|uniref:rhomboid family intramembrane serine protease n=1 Tax=Dethiobacter alkaliphilus TaxID=427926 RepID=UPI002225DBF3|nr:rhomboid family intramembrane serine protease [Dethiobacter alkaliphilus]MCW3491568.1 rhomboid family intramembrane serine protease [Dethiobacter alkaliphilus]
MSEIIDIKKNPVSLLFFIMAAGIFFVARGTDPENIRFLAFDYEALPQRWYAILTYGFVHVDWNHIIINMGLLIWIGIWVERLIGSNRYIVLVLGGILAGGLTLLLRETAGIGFSAGAAAIVFYYHFAFPMKRELPFGLPNVVLPVVLLIVSVGAIIFGWLPAVGHYPHIAGALVGIVFLGIFSKHHKPIHED